MKRKDFLMQCGFACAGTVGLAGMLAGCSIGKRMTGTIIGDDLVVSLSDFESKKRSSKGLKNYLVIEHEILQYPVCIYRLDENKYSALWMRCPHQGAELQVFGDKIQCPAHGSEFSNQGEVQSGPADSALRTFPVTITNNEIKISLKRI